MAGSRGGKHSKSKGKSKSKKSDTINKKTELLTSKLDLSQAASNSNPSGPNGPKDSKGKNPQQNVNDTMTTSRSKYTENELEEFLYVKLEDLYAEAKDILLKSGYSIADVERAILNNGYIHGPVDLLDNILVNSIAFIEGKVQVKREAFKDMSSLYKTMLETLIDSVMPINPDMQRSDAMWYLLVRTCGCIPSTTMHSHLRTRDQNTNKNEDARAADSSSAAEKVPSELNIESSVKNVRTSERISRAPALMSRLRQNIPILAAAVKKETGTPVIEEHAFQSAWGELTEGPDFMGSDFLTSITGCSYEASLRRWLESNPNDPKILQIFDLVENIRDLQEEVNEQKEWAQQKVVDSAIKLSKDLLELKILRMKKVDVEHRNKEKLYAEKSFTLKILEKEQSLRDMNCQASFITETVRRLETTNAQIKADIEALKLNASESDRVLNEVLKRERRCMKKLAAIGEQTSNFRALCDEEKKRVLQLQLEVSQAKKDVEQAEISWRQEIKEKEQMFSLLAEETRTAEIQKANYRAKLSKLRQKLEIDSQLRRDDHQRLEDELARLRISHQLSDVSVEDDKFFYNGVEVAPLEAQCESSFNHWKCMICSHNEVSIVLLPCTHQVLCLGCYGDICRTVEDRCPYCQVKIEQAIRVYGPSS